tara:strand:+ start:157 stop:546 length:390 start_codon:yes stop_codon:yes gene_type:complete
MGRYYSGDIDGKFWFAVQSSNCADRFGYIGNNPNYLEYWFDEEHLETINKELKTIESNLGENLKLLKEFFKTNNGYNDEMLKTFFKEKGKTLGDGDIKYMLEEYADYGMGKRIRDCVKENGECNFTAEL